MSVAQVIRREARKDFDEADEIDEVIGPMTLHLPEDLERALKAAVLGGEFASEEEAIAEAVRSFLRQRETRPTRPTGPGPIGAMRDDAELLDQAVAHAMKVREERPWRLNLGE